MFDIFQIEQRFFDVKLRDRTLKIKSPTVDEMDRIIAISTDMSLSITERLIKPLEIAFGAAEGKQKDLKDVLKGLSMDEAAALLDAYFSWILGVSCDPN